MKKTSIFLILLTVVLVSISACYGKNSKSKKTEASKATAAPATQAASAPATQETSPESEPAGEFFGVPVPKSNYYFVMRTVLTFGTPWGVVPSNIKELETRIWDDLLLSYEAFRRNIKVENQELESEIEKTLSAEKVSFDWKKDKDAYEKWSKEKMGIPVEFFENQLRHLLQLRKLYQQIIDDANPPVQENDMYQKFLNEYNTLSLELVQFDDLASAQEFYEKAKKDKNFWNMESEKDKQKERKDSRFRQPGFVSLEFLIDMWKFPKDALYEMLKMEVGSIYPPQPIYKGYGVFKVLEIRKADETEFPKRREYYRTQILQRNKWREFSKWLKDLKKESNLKVYIHPPENLFKNIKTQ